ncbi:hypothetical protein EIP91_001192 [Steccherinum ochraceum]|uniref:Uncharacterized protein n=1 Tax=Steccherinum ochraceum TaxID=92696 RepID=A0A4R0S2Y1_9APHY|nr:hypothetical protein EIP91_001192 [Steccherinum ochraceum]
MTSVFTSSQASLAHRARIAQIITANQRVHPTVPFWKLQVHRVPTLWTLYRGLLRNSSTDDVRWRIRRVFEQFRHLTTPRLARPQLLKYHKWLDTFIKAKEGDVYYRAVLQRYSRMVVAKRDKEDFKQMVREAFEWQRKLYRRPIMTGAYLRPTVANPPLPRLRPQPEHISGMIHKRRRATNRQYIAVEEADRTIDELKYEKEFEEKLTQEAQANGVQMKTFFSDKFQDWTSPLIDIKKENRERISAGIRRRDSPYPPEMLEAIKQARREKVANKTKELQREARGEVLRRTVFRARAGPPAHILSKMTPLQKRMDKVSRSSVSEVGYVGMVKRKLGWKLKNPNAWKVEIGKKEDTARMDALAAEIRQENEKRSDNLFGEP